MTLIILLTLSFKGKIQQTKNSDAFNLSLQSSCLSRAIMHSFFIKVSYLKMQRYINKYLNAKSIELINWG